ncbi:MAG: thiamine biosynthesis lipoprotein precursor [Conexibacter sp.]|nr:thiamine biosynthesis lipoprotein precursor [Conexibacter sp.]
MGMPVGVDVRDVDVDPGVLDALFAWLRFVDATFSTYREDSEICRLNAGTLASAAAHPLVREVLDRCAQLREETGGAFDAWSVTPGAVDPTGLVKGWAVERAATLLRRGGARRFAINAGGDVRLGDPPPGQRAWRVGVRHPLQSDRLAAVAAVTDGAVATSGAYERGAHIVDPRSGRAPDGVLSVTIVGSDLGRADAYATAAFALGREGPAWTAGLDGYEALTILADETIRRTPGFPLAALATAAPVAERARPG